MSKKQGDLRVRKAGTVFGPMGRADLDRLLSAGKIAPCDQVSVRGGNWIELGDYLASTASQRAAAPEAAPPAASTPPCAPPDESDPVLRLLANGRIVASLSRAEVTQLRVARRIDDEDLICALYGPWMRVGDFLSAPHATPPATLLEEHAEARGPDEGQPTELTPSAVAAAGPARPVPAPIAAVVAPGPAFVSAPYPAAGLVPMDSSLSDEWFVRVRGIHSAPLGKIHVKALFDAHEITPDNAARHASWPDNVWVPIRTIAQLAEAVS
ncbi:MAG TPA: hypothetical protein VND64_11555 [Pirellulales bacterium]|nr:hypothetical protein [Pirellulales bacterium]